MKHRLERWRRNCQKASHIRSMRKILWDFRDLYADGPTYAYSWNKTSLTYSIDKYGNAGTKLGEAAIDAVIRSACDVWEKHSELTFSKVAKGTGDLKIAFVTGAHEEDAAQPNDPMVLTQAFDGPGQIGVPNTLAHAWPPTDPNFPWFERSGDVHYDDDENWVIGGGGAGTDLLEVSIHEIGHAIGLAHSAVRSAMMYPTYSGTKSDLDNDDILGINEIYKPSALVKKLFAD